MPLVAPHRPSTYDARPMAPEPRRVASSGPTPGSGLARNILIPTSIVLCFVLVYVVGVPVKWVLPIGAAFMLLYVLAPVLARRSLASFDREAVQLLASGRRSQLVARYRRALGMRLFAAPALVAQRRGMVASELGHASAARAAFEEASEGWGGEPPLAVRLGLAHASFALRDDGEAIRHYRRVLGEAPGLPHVARNLAHALARHGDDLVEAERLSADLLAKAGDGASAELALLRALVHAKRGQRGPARKLLRATEDATGLAVESLRAEVEAALGALKDVSRPSA